MEVVQISAVCHQKRVIGDGRRSRVVRKEHASCRISVGFGTRNDAMITSWYLKDEY